MLLSILHLVMGQVLLSHSPPSMLLSMFQLVMGLCCTYFPGLISTTVDGPYSTWTTTLSEQWQYCSILFYSLKQTLGELARWGKQTVCMQTIHDCFVPNWFLWTLQQWVPFELRWEKGLHGKVSQAEHTAKAQTQMNKEITGSWHNFFALKF